MTLLGSVANLFFLSAGVSFVCMLMVLGVNDVLRRMHLGFLELESLLSGMYGRFEHPGERAIHGLLSLFIVSWGATIAFLVSWQLSGFQQIVGGSILVGVFIFGVLLYFLASLIVFPLTNHGAFGTRLHPKAPLSTLLLVLAYILVLGFILSILF